MEESERERLEALLEAVTLAGNADQVRQEVGELQRLATQAQAVEEAGAEAKLSKLEDLLQKKASSSAPTSAFSSSPSSGTPWTTW